MKLVKGVLRVMMMEELGKKPGCVRSWVRGVGVDDKVVNVEKKNVGLITNV